MRKILVALMLVLAASSTAEACGRRPIRQWIQDRREARTVVVTQAAPTTTQAPVIQVAMANCPNGICPIR